MGILRDTLTLFSGGVEQKLATQMLFDKVIGFKGVTAGAGATTLLYNIAVMLSQRTMFRVAVVDTSMEFPCLFTLLGASLDDTAKGDIFDYIAKDKVLPRKAFSMGHATEKRYYLESQRIK